MDKPVVEIKFEKNKILQADDINLDNNTDEECSDTENEDDNYEEDENDTLSIIQKKICNYTEYLPLCEYLCVEDIRYFYNTLLNKSK